MVGGGDPSSTQTGIRHRRVNRASRVEFVVTVSRHALQIVRTPTEPTVKMSAPAMGLSFLGSIIVRNNCSPQDETAPHGRVQDSSHLRLPSSTLPSRRDALLPCDRFDLRRGQAVDAPPERFREGLLVRSPIGLRSDKPKAAPGPARDPDTSDSMEGDPGGRR